MGFLDGKAAIVTGGYSGIGAGIAYALAVEGSDVVIVARDIEKLKSYADEVNTKLDTMKLHPYAVDLTNAGAATQLFDYAVDMLGKVDIIANCAGVHFYDSKTDPDTRQRNNLVNVISKQLLNKYAMEHIKKNGGNIINISSMAAKNAYPDQSGYHEDMRQIAEDTVILRSNGVNAQAIAPGLVDTPLARRDFPDVDWSQVLTIQEIGDITVKMLKGEIQDTVHYVQKFEA